MTWLNGVSKMPVSKLPHTCMIATPVDIPGLKLLVERVFNQFEVPDYSEEGIAEFLKYIDESAWMNRMTAGAFTMVWREGQVPIGVIEIRDGNHLSLLFVDGKYHRQGIATHLWQLALKHCLDLNNQIEKITVNSSPYALPFYTKLGFIPTDGRKQVNGIIFYPMLFHVKK
jgi:GNAT superfamily N-acetyltransferase